MPDILIRNLDSDTVKQLKKRAKRHGRSLQQEIRVLLDRAVCVEGARVAAILKRWQKRFVGRKFTSSVRLFRKDRDR